MIFMTHPLHGAHNAEQIEVEKLKKIGWVESTPEEWFALIKPELCKNKVEIPEEKVVSIRRGRPPKH